MSLIRLIAPRLHRRRLAAEQMRALRSRDGDSCARCRRPLRFDLPGGHDQGPIIESGHLCHRRCNAAGIDHTSEVADRMRRKAEAALFVKSRRKRRAA